MGALFDRGNELDRTLGAKATKHEVETALM